MKRSAAITLITVMCLGLFSACRGSKAAEESANGSDTGVTAMETEDDEQETAAGASTLEEILSDPENRAGLDAECDSDLSLYSDYYSDIRWEARGNSFSYMFYYAEDYDDADIAVIKDSLEGSSDTLTKEIDSDKESFETAYGIRPEQITYAYLTKSGKEIYSITR